MYWYFYLARCVLYFFAYCSGSTLPCCLNECPIWPPKYIGLCIWSMAFKKAVPSLTDFAPQSISLSRVQQKIFQWLRPFGRLCDFTSFSTVPCSNHETLYEVEAMITFSTLKGQKAWVNNALLKRKEAFFLSFWYFFRFFLFYS